MEKLDKRTMKYFLENGYLTKKGTDMVLKYLLDEPEKKTWQDNIMGR